MPDTSPTPSTIPTTPKTPRDYAEQDQAIADNITSAEQAINGALASEEILALLEPRSYDAKELKVGLGLQEAAQEAFNARQTASGQEAFAKGARDKADAAARAQFSDYRQTCQINFTQPADRGALGANGKVLTDSQKFITTARSAYAAAGKAPYADTLEVYGYDAKKLKEAQVGLDVLSNAETEYSRKAGATINATQARDDAHEELMKWFSKFRRFAKLALKSQPGLLEKLK